VDKCLTKAQHRNALETKLGGYSAKYGLLLVKTGRIGALVQLATAA
jgi:hypothetical protein